MKKVLLLFLVLLGLTSCSMEDFFGKPTTPDTHEHSILEGFKFDEVNHWQECESCDEKVNSATHVFGDWEVVTEATESAEGLKRKACECGYAVEEKIDALTHTHTPSNDWSKDENEHWHSCEGCSELLDKAAHSYVEGVCECGQAEPVEADDAYIVGYGSYTTADWTNEGGVKFNVMNDEPNALEKYSVTLDLDKGDCLMFKVLAADDAKWYGYTFIKGVTLKAENPTNYEGSFFSSIGDNNVNCDVAGNYTFYLIVWEGYAADVYVEVNSFSLPEEVVFEDAYLVGTGSYTTADWTNEGGVKFKPKYDTTAFEEYVINIDLQADDVLVVHLMSTPDRWYGYDFVRRIDLKAENPTNYEGDFLVTYGDNNIKCMVSGNYTFYVAVWQNYAVDIYAEVNSFTLPAPHKHSYSEEWSKDENNHWHECLCGDKKDLEAHKGGTATTSEQAVCEVCNTAYGALITETIYTVVLNEVTYQMEINPGNTNEYMYKGLKVDLDQIISFKLNGNLLNVSAKDGADATNSDAGIKISKKGTADLYLDVSGDELKLWIQITPDVIDYYLKGNMNGWVANDGYAFSEGVLEITLYRGMAFKVSEETWNDVTTLGFDKLTPTDNFVLVDENIMTKTSGKYKLEAKEGTLTATLLETITDKYSIEINGKVYDTVLNTGSSNVEWALYDVIVNENDKIIIKNNDYVIVTVGIDGSDANGIQGSAETEMTIKSYGLADFYLTVHDNGWYAAWVAIEKTYTDAYIVGYGSYLSGSGDWSIDTGVKMTCTDDNPDAMKKYVATVTLKAGDCILIRALRETGDAWNGYPHIKGNYIANFKAENEGSNNAVVLVDGEYTIYYTIWKDYSAELWIEWKELEVMEDAYIVGTGSYLTGNKWAWENECGVKMNKHEGQESTEYAKYSATVELKAGDVFGIRYMASNATEGVWYGASVLNNGCDISASINTSGNFEVLADGSYTIYLTIWNNETHAAEIWINKN